MSLAKSAVAAVAMSISLTAFGAGTHGGGHGHGASSGEPGKASDASRSITVDMYDNYYEPETIEVKPGETVRFVVQNKGQLVHEFNIGTPDMHEAHQKEMIMMVEHGIIQGGKLNHDMMEMDMGNGQTMKHDDPNSVLLEPGESQEVVWTFSEKGDIEFACNVPGHYQAGMYGDVSFNSEDSPVRSLAGELKPLTATQ
ncbi:cupredoxin domain-containing protein [Marinobacter sp. 1-3A]|uniref:cupredoxin domain-containing protein n=1 Tax=Marinobacter sp. 1-3A TaxID=2582920 RepID=UPI001904CCDA|nr:plastocyanin/azurin family copper-binding protein [Marinobacter sp. 1-3A]MBK1874496.1 cupredoxin domain-containing protein [Marinobacter sp. 1-3A]